MIVTDAHLDLAWNALGWNRDLTQDIQDMRKSEFGMKGKGRGVNTASLSEMRRGDVAVCLATVLARASGLGEPMLDFRTQEIAYAMAKGQLAYYRILESQGQLEMLRNRRDLKAHIDKWTVQGHPTPPLGLIPSMEGAGPIASPGQVMERWMKG